MVEGWCQMKLTICVGTDLAKGHIHVPSILFYVLVDPGLLLRLESAYPAVLKMFSLSPWFRQATLENQNFQVLVEGVVMLVEVFGKFVVVWSFLGVISVFWESFIKWIAGLSDVNEITLLADCCVDDVFRSAGAPIFDLNGDVLLRVCNGLCRPYLRTKFAISACLGGFVPLP